MKRFAFVALLMLSMLSLHSVQANPGSVAFTTTADFDAGNKTPQAGNLQIETNTDNQGVAVNSMELGSLKGDRFTLADLDANTQKWQFREAGEGTGTGSGSIAAGVLSLRATRGDQAIDVAVTTDVLLSGTLDIRVITDITTCVTDSFFIFQILNEEVITSATVDGVRYDISSDCAGLNLRAFTVTNGVATQVGLNTATPGDPLYRRMTRSGTTWTWFYSLDGSAWTQDEQTTFTVTGDLSVYLGASAGGAGADARANYDDFYVAEGTIATGGFRTSGTWTSATQTFSGEVVSQVDVAFTGVSASNFIDAISVLDSSNSVIFIDETDWTSGTSATITVPYSQLLQTDWRIRILITGAGAGTPNIEDITVTTNAPPSGGQGGGNRRVTVECSLDWLLQSIACTDLTVYGSAAVIGIGWYLDGRFVQETAKNAHVILPTYDGFIDSRSNVSHQVIMEVRLINGGKQANTFTVDGDYSPRILLFTGIALLIPLGLLLVRRRAVTRSVAFPRITNPSYRRTAIKVEEHPAGWVSYRQRDPDKYTAFRSKCIRKVGRKCTVIAVFGLRPAKPGERAKTGRRRIAELQTVRERMRK